MKRHEAGFTLVELAISLAVVALLAGSLLAALGPQRDAARLRETRLRLADAREALLGFAVAYGRLPCPAAAAESGGTESPDDGSGACTVHHVGYLPAASLGLGPTDERGYLLDAWHRPIRYAVAQPNSIHGVLHPLTAPNGLRSAGIQGIGDSGELLHVCASAAGLASTHCGTAVTLAAKTPAVIYSAGPNGDGNDADEAANRNEGDLFVSHPPTPPGSPEGEFDDVLDWLSLPTLFGRLVAAGKLP